MKFEDTKVEAGQTIQGQTIQWPKKKGKTTNNKLSKHYIKAMIIGILLVKLQYK